MAELESAVAYWKASQYDYLNADASGKLLDLSGNGHDGTISGATFRAHDGDSYLIRPNAAADNYVSVPNHTKFDIVDDGDIDLRCILQAPDYTPSDYIALLRNQQSNTGGWLWDINVTTGTMRFIVTDTGGDNTATSDDPSFTDGTKQGVRVTWDASADTATFYKMDDPDGDITSSSGWTQIGATKSTGVTVGAATNQPLYFAGLSSYAYLGGGIKYFDAAIYDGIAGTLVGRFNADDYTDLSTTYTDGQGNVWTINRDLTDAELIRVVDRSHLWFDGTDDRVDAGNTLASIFDSDFTVAAGFRSYSLGSYMTIVGTYDATDGWVLQTNDTASGEDGRFFVDDGPDNALVDTTPLTDGAAHTLVGVLDRSGANDIEVFLDGTASGSPTSATSIGNLSGGGNLNIGRYPASQYFKGEIWAVAIFDAALTDAQVANLDTELNTAYVASAADAYMSGVRFWIDARHHQSTGSTLVTDLSGNGHNASSLTNTLFYEHSGTNYMRLPGISLNHAETPDATAWDIIDDGDIDIRVLYAADDWTPASAEELVSKLEFSGASGWMVDLQPDGKIRWLFGDGAARSATSSVATGFTNGEVGGIRVTYDSSAGNANFYTYDNVTETSDLTDDGAWSQLGTADVSTGATTGTTNTKNVRIGCRADTGGSSPCKGNMYAVLVMDGTLGVSMTRIGYWVADDWTDRTTTYTDSEFKVWTMNTTGTAEVARIVQRPHWWFDTNAYLDWTDISEFDFNGSDFTVGVAGASWDIGNGTADHFFSKRNSAAAGWLIEKGTGDGFGFIVEDTGSTLNSRYGGAAVTAGQQFTQVGAYDYGTNLERYEDGVATGSPTTDTTTGNFSSSATVRIGARGVSLNHYVQGEVYGAFIFNTLKSAAEIANLDTVLDGTLSILETFTLETTLTHLSSGLTIYSPTLTLNSDLSYIAAATNIYSPSLRLNLTLSYLGSTTTIYGLTITQALQIVAYYEGIYGAGFKYEVTVDPIAETEGIYGSGQEYTFKS